MTFLNDKQRSGLITFLGSIFPLLNLAGFVSLTGDEVSIVMLAVVNGLNWLALIFPSTAATTTTVSTPGSVDADATIRISQPSNN